MIVILFPYVNPCVGVSVPSFVKLFKTKCTLKINYFNCPSRLLVSRGSVVSIATAYRLDDRGVGVRVPAG
jgi:hypothetical protein